VRATRTLRRASQWVVFLLFAFLFLNTEYKDNDVLPYAVNLFLRLDPLMAGAVTLAGRALIGLVWPALVVALLTVALGRFFCVGCGICETKCPLTDRAAVLVTSRGETRSTGVLAR
jgi:ferredoxin